MLIGSHFSLPIDATADTVGNDEAASLTLKQVANTVAWELTSDDAFAVITPELNIESAEESVELAFITLVAEADTVEPHEADPLDSKIFVALEDADEVALKDASASLNLCELTTIESRDASVTDPVCILSASADASEVQDSIAESW